MESRVFLKGYTIGYGFDEESGKYYLINQETNEATRPFVDEVLFSEAPLETWVANYVVVRIGELYYIADSEGNCYFEESTPFIICRNVFVQGEKKYVVDKSMQKRTYDGEIKILESKKYKYAIVDKFLIKANGIPYDFEFKSSNYLVARKLDSGYIEFRGFQWYILDKNFEPIKIYSDAMEISLIGPKSKTYMIKYSYLHDKRVIYYSSFFESEISNIDVFGELEVVCFVGKTYFFGSNAKIDCVEGKISVKSDSNDSVMYREGKNIVIRDIKTGEVTETKILSAEEFYKFLMYEEMVDSLKEEMRKLRLEMDKFQKEVLKKLENMD